MCDHSIPDLVIQQDSREVAALISARSETELCAPPLEVSPTAYACRQCVARGLREVPTIFAIPCYLLGLFTDPCLSGAQCTGKQEMGIHTIMQQAVAELCASSRRPTAILSHSVCTRDMAPDVSNIDFSGLRLYLLFTRLKHVKN